MLRFTVELVPHGDETRTRPLGTIEVGNTGNGTPWLGQYRFRRRASDGRLLKEGYIGEFHRKSFGPWVLLHGVLEALGLNDKNAWRDGAPRSKLRERLKP